jgi:hypothetical protein
LAKNSTVSGYSTQKERKDVLNGASDAVLTLSMK